MLSRPFRWFRSLQVCQLGKCVPDLANDPKRSDSCCDYTTFCTLLLKSRMMPKRKDFYRVITCLCLFVMAVIISLIYKNHTVFSYPFYAIWETCSWWLFGLRQLWHSFIHGFESMFPSSKGWNHIQVSGCCL